MRTLRFALILLFIVIVKTVSLLKDRNKFDRSTPTFNSFSEEYQKTYTSTNQLKFRQKVFNNNIDVVRQLNQNPNNTYPQGTTYYSDLTPDEFKYLVLNKKLSITPEVLIDITKQNNSISVEQEKPKQEVSITTQKSLQNKQYKKKKKQQVSSQNKENKKEELKKQKKLLEKKNKKIQQQKQQQQKKKQQKIKQNRKKFKDQNQDKKEYSHKKQFQLTRPYLLKQNKVELTSKQVSPNIILQSVKSQLNAIKSSKQVSLLNQASNNTQQTQVKQIQEVIQKWIPPEGALPSIDWRMEGKVSNVKMQGNCGNCYSFSTTGALQGAMMIKHNLSKISYSDQQITDCCSVKGYGCNGCDGGWQWQALRYVLDHGIVTEDQYQLESSESGQVGQCKKIFSPNKILRQEAPFSIIQPGNVSMLYQMVSKQPVSVGVDSQNMQFVLSGDTTALFTNCSSNPQDANHAMLIVGYDIDGNWILKNSWSSHWGDNGYIKLKAGNTCGVANFALYPNVI